MTEGDRGEKDEDFFYQYQLPRTWVAVVASHGRVFLGAQHSILNFFCLSSFIVPDSSSFSSEVEKYELIEFNSTLFGKTHFYSGKLIFTQEVLDPKFHKNDE